MVRFGSDLAFLCLSAVGWQLEDLFSVMQGWASAVGSIPNLVPSVTGKPYSNVQSRSRLQPRGCLQPTSRPTKAGNRSVLPSLSRWDLPSPMDNVSSVLVSVWAWTVAWALNLTPPCPLRPMQLSAGYFPSLHPPQLPQLVPARIQENQNVPPASSR